MTFPGGVKQHLYEWQSDPIRRTSCHFPVSHYYRPWCSAVLLKLFMDSAGSPASDDQFEHVAAILNNVTRQRKGREMLLEPGRGFMQALVAQLGSASVLRRQGCASAFRNCCFSAEVGLLG